METSFLFLILERIVEFVEFLFPHHKDTPAIQTLRLIRINLDKYII
jgi:hypothetical protein